MKSPFGWGRRFSTNIWLVLLNTFLMFAGISVLGLIYNLYLSSLGYREDFIGLFNFANTAAIGVFAIPAGGLSTRYGPRACLAVASAATGLATALVSLTADPTLIIAGALLLGAANAAVFVPGGPFLMENSGDEERLSVFSANFAVMSCGSVLGSLASGYLPRALSAIGAGPADGTAVYQITLVVGAIVCGLAAVPMVLARPAQPRPSSGRATDHVVVPLGEREARRLLVPTVVAVFVISVAAGVILPFFNVYFTKHLGASVESVGIIFAATALVVVPVSLTGPALARRLGTAGAICFPRALAAPFLLLPALLPTMPIGTLTYVARITIMGPTWPLDNAFLMSLMPPRMRSLQSGIRSASWNAGWALGSLLAGQAIVSLGYPIVFVASAVLTFAAAAFYFFSFRRFEKPATGPAPRAAPA